VPTPIIEGDASFRPPDFSPESPLIHTTKTAAESSVSASVARVWRYRNLFITIITIIITKKNICGVNLCRHLPNHSRTAKINSPKYALFGGKQAWHLILYKGAYYQTKVRDVDKLKQSTLDVWRGLKLSVVNDAMNEWRKRLRARIRAKGHFFKNVYWFKNTHMPSFQLIISWFCEH